LWKGTALAVPLTARKPWALAPERLLAGYGNSQFRHVCQRMTLKHRRSLMALLDNAVKCGIEQWQILPGAPRLVVFETWDSYGTGN